MNRDTAHTLWIMLLKRKLKYSPDILSKLSKIRIDKNGNIIKYGRAWKYANKHFPAFIKKFEEMKEIKR